MSNGNLKGEEKTHNHPHTKSLLRTVSAAISERFSGVNAWIAWKWKQQGWTQKHDEAELTKNFLDGLLSGLHEHFDEYNRPDLTGHGGHVLAVKSDESGEEWREGKTILNGKGPPRPEHGMTGDLYLDTQSFDLYGPKNGFWGVGASLKGSDGRTLLSGTIDPGPDVGVDGDFFINTDRHLIYGPKTGGSWSAGVELRGKTILNGKGPPRPEHGTTGDFYLDTQSFDLYGPKNGVWGAGASLKGSDGRTLLSGTIDPGPDVGVDGDFFINTDRHLIYGPKAGGSWPAGVELRGATGPAGADGNTVLYGVNDPAPDQGLLGNFYINTTRHYLFGPKASSGWPAGTSLIPRTEEPAECQQEEWTEDSASANKWLDVQDGSGKLLSVSIKTEAGQYVIALVSGWVYAKARAGVGEEYVDFGIFVDGEPRAITRVKFGFWLKDTDIPLNLTTACTKLSPGGHVITLRYNKCRDTVLTSTELRLHFGKLLLQALRLW